MIYAPLALVIAQHTTNSHYVGAFGSVSALCTWPPAVVGQAYLSGKGANNLQFAQDGFNFAYQLGQTIAGSSDTLTLCAKGASNGDDICGTLKWVDLT